MTAVGEFLVPENRSSTESGDTGGDDMSRCMVSLRVEFEWEPNTILGPDDIALAIVTEGFDALGHKNVVVTIDDVNLAQKSTDDCPLEGCPFTVPHYHRGDDEVVRIHPESGENGVGVSEDGNQQ